MGKKKKSLFNRCLASGQAGSQAAVETGEKLWKKHNRGVVVENAAQVKIEKKEKRGDHPNVSEDCHI